MAQGDITWFNAAKVNVGLKKFDLNGDTLNVGLIKSAANGGLDPTASTADPRWGTGGTTNVSSSEVTAGGNYSAGGSSIGTHSWAASGSAGVLSASAVLTWNQNAGNPTNARWGVLYDSTNAAKECLAFVDLGSDRNMTTGPLTIDWGDSPVTNSIIQIT